MERQPRSTTRWVLLAVLVLAAAGFLLWRGRTQRAAGGAAVASAGARAGGAGGPAGAAARAVPVTAVAAVRRDVPVYLQGLGTAVASQTVTVKPQVDGRLAAVRFQEGQAVRRGDVLAQIDPRPFQIALQQAQGALARDEAQLRNARIVLQRDRQLLAEKLIAPQQLDTDQAVAGQLEGAVQVDQAAIAAARLNLEYATITAPIDGVTGLRQVDVGNLIHASDANGLVLLTQLDPISVLFTLPQDELAAVMAEMAKGPLAVEVYGRDGAAVLGTGQLALVDNQINQATSTMRLKAVVPNPRRLLWPNAFVNARLRLAVRQGALVVPAVALQRGPSGTFVYVVGPDATATPRPVQVGMVQGEQAILTAGVTEGEQVVVEGQNTLRPGAKVAARPAGERRPPGGQRTEASATP